MAWSNEINWDRFITARKLAETTEPCSREVHSSQANSPMLFLRIAGHEAYFVCSKCGRTFDEIVDVEAERSGGKKHAGGRPRKVEEAATA
jgi:protein-arginine kinase activator protein McsA